MNGYYFTVLFYTVAALDAGTSEFVWLRDLNVDEHKRHMDLGLSEEIRFQLNRGKKSINLHLKENPHIRADTDIYVVKEMPDGTKRAVKEQFTGNVESKYYHDVDNSAFFTVRCVKRANGPCVRTLEGSLIIGDNYFHIAPVSNLSNADNFYMNKEYQDIPHVIREEMANDVDFHQTDDTMIPSLHEEEAVKKSLPVNLQRLLAIQNVEGRAFDRHKRATTVYGVEMLVVVDPPVWEKFYALADKDTQNAMKRVREYVSHVINGVAMTYKSIKGRDFSIQITLKAITVIKKVKNGPYTDAKIIERQGQLHIDDGDYLNAFADWVVNTPGIPSRSDIDYAMMLTGYVHIYINLFSIAYMGAVCRKSGVALATEAGYFKTMIVASHELAHGLGAKHDVQVGCQKGNIMGMKLPALVKSYSHQAWEFSECSIDAFSKTLAERPCVYDEATFYNKDEYDNYNKHYPGEIYSTDEQCKIAFGPNSYECYIPDPDKICLSLPCYNTRRHYCVKLFAADGTQCGTGNMVFGYTDKYLY
ncbi:hypothetical protein ACJMK2_017732 [Sinanodonta woodiana]|uniref:Peptidase M12B domain-containing protein n=1 Tax=Sinanodonta woodiana TaxID=1069815 RepID=A0ABD3UDY4_SINWO